MPRHHSGKRAGSYRSFHTSSTGAALIAASSNCGTWGSRVGGVAKLALDALELARRLDGRERRAPEVHERGGDVAATGTRRLAAPSGRRLPETPLGERLVAAGPCDERLHVREAGHERRGAVAGADRLLRHRAQLGL